MSVYSQVRFNFMRYIQVSMSWSNSIASDALAPCKTSCCTVNRPCSCTRPEILNAGATERTFYADAPISFSSVGPTNGTIQAATPLPTTGFILPSVGYYIVTLSVYYIGTNFNLISFQLDGVTQPNATLFTPELAEGNMAMTAAVQTTAPNQTLSVFVGAGEDSATLSYVILTITRYA